MKLPFLFAVILFLVFAVLLGPALNFAKKIVVFHETNLSHKKQPLELG